MADLSGLMGNLTRLKSEIQQRLPGALLGRPNNDAEAERRSDELGKLAERLILLIRDLKSYENLLTLQQRAASSIASRDARSVADGLRRSRHTQRRQGPGLRQAGGNTAATARPRPACGDE